MKKLLIVILALTMSLALFSCDIDSIAGSLNGNADEGEDVKHDIYMLAAQSGYAGTYEDWLASVRGEPGEDGKAIQLSVINGSIAYRYEGQASWTTLITLSDLAGTNDTAFRVNDGSIEYQNGEEWVALISLADLRGESGESGREVELTVNGGYICYRYDGDNDWINLVELASLTGAKGEDGKNGTDGREIELTVVGGYISYRYEGDGEWRALVEIASLMGAAGKDGANGKDGKDGREVEFTVDGGFIKYKYTDELTWRSLIDLTTLKGENGADGKDGENGKDGLNGENGKDGRDPVFRVHENKLQWQYAGDSVWQDLIDLGELAPDTDAGTDSGSTGEPEDYDFGEFVAEAEPELVEALSVNGKRVLKYKVGTMYYVPISYGFIQQIYKDTDIMLSYALSEATETSIEQGITRANTMSAEIGFGADIKGLQYEVEAGTSLSVERMYNFIKTTSNMEQYSGTFTVNATPANVGKYYRVVLVTNVDYFVYYECDYRDPDKIVCSVSPECRSISGDYQFIAKLQSSDSSEFDNTMEPITEATVSISKDRLESDGIFNVTKPLEYVGTYTDSDVISLGGFNMEQGDFMLYSEMQIFEQLFGYKKETLDATNIPMNMVLDYSFVYNKVRNQPADIRIIVTGSKIKSYSADYTFDELVEHMKDTVGVYANVSYTLPMGDRYTDVTVTVPDINITMSGLDEDFYVYVFNLSESEIEIKDHIYSYHISADAERLATRFTTDISGKSTIYSGNTVKKTVSFDGENTPDLTVEEYLKLGITELEVSITYTCGKKGGILPSFRVLNSAGSVIADPNTVYHNEQFLTTVQNSLITTEVTATFVIDLTKIDTLGFVLEWSALETPANTSGTCYITVEDISIDAILK